MNEEKIRTINECISKLSRLRAQLAENAVSFKTCTSADIYQTYLSANQSALQACDTLQNQLHRLLQIELSKSEQL